MQENSTTFLEFIAKNDCYILFEKSVPGGRLKQDHISLASTDGRRFGLQTSMGFSSSEIEIPRSMFDDFMAASLIEQDRPEDSDGRIFFRLTRDGKVRGLQS